MKLKIFCRFSLFPSWSGYGLISRPGIINQSMTLWFTLHLLDRTEGL